LPGSWGRLRDFAKIKPSFVLQKQKQTVRAMGRLPNFSPALCPIISLSQIGLVHQGYWEHDFTLCWGYQAVLILFKEFMQKGYVI
jgi:hypothetical protein